MKWVWGPYDWNSVKRRWTLPTGCVAGIDMRSLADQSPQSMGQRNIALFAATDDATFGADHLLLGQGDPREAYITVSQRNSIKQALNLPTLPSGPTVSWLAFELLTEFADPDGSEMAMPLVPGHLRRWQVTMPGMMVRRAFSQSDPAYPKLRELLQRTYARICQECTGDQHRRWLGFQCRKYFRTWNDPRWTEIAGRGAFARESPLCPTTTVSDNFNRADESLDAGNWTEITGDWSVTSNAAAPDNNGTSFFARYDTNLSGDDHYSQCVISDEDSGCIARMPDTTTQTFYYTFVDAEGVGGLLNVKLVAGSPTVLSSTSGDTLPATAKMECDGSTITASVGTSSTNATDTAITGQTRCGINADRGPIFQPTCDDFEAADLGGGPSGPPLGSLALMGVGR